MPRLSMPELNAEETQSMKFFMGDLRDRITSAERKGNHAEARILTECAGIVGDALISDHIRRDNLTKAVTRKLQA